MAFVDPIGHQYLDDPVAREEGGTPAIVESIRAGLVFALKQAVGTDLIAAREEQLWRHVLRRWAGSPGIEVLGSHQAARLSILSFRIRHGTQYLHHNFVVALLNDLFGIQARGGCSCAGPYGHRLLAIGPARSHALREEIGHGCDGVKPGWTRVNLNYFISAGHGRLHRRRGRADRRRRLPAAPGRRRVHHLCRPGFRMAWLQGGLSVTAKDPSSPRLMAANNPASLVPPGLISVPCSFLSIFLFIQRGC